jgi:hypothetical protein
VALHKLVNKCQNSLRFEITKCFNIYCTRLHNNPHNTKGQLSMHSLGDSNFGVVVYIWVHTIFYKMHRCWWCNTQWGNMLPCSNLELMFICKRNFNRSGLLHDCSTFFIATSNNMMYGTRPHMVTYFECKIKFEIGNLHIVQAKIVSQSLFCLWPECPIRDTLLGIKNLITTSYGT